MEMISYTFSIQPCSTDNVVLATYVYLNFLQNIYILKIQIKAKSISNCAYIFLNFEDRQND
jgi:hypothetical protein